MYSQTIKGELINFLILTPIGHHAPMFLKWITSFLDQVNLHLNSQQSVYNRVLWKSYFVGIAWKFLISSEIR